MKNLKKKIIAFAAAFVIILGSTLLSVNLRLSKEFSAVTDGFYSGQLANGNKEPSLHSQLLIVAKGASELASIAEKNGLDVEDFKYEAEYFSRDVITMQDDISYIFYCYQNILDELMTLGQSLTTVNLGSFDESAAVNCLQSIMNAQAIIDASGYNESVRQYISSLQSPTLFFAELAGVDLPEYFA